jgi:RNA polymerase sigma factor (sigma-70 family)
MRQDLVRRAMAGDHGAFSELARASIGRLYATARLILHDDQRAEDATQEALVAAWRDLSALRDPARFDAWLNRILVRACYQEARRGRRRWSIESEIREFETATGSDPDPGLGLADRDQLERGFRRLATDQRVVIVLHYYLGYTLNEIGDTLGVPPGTVRSRLHRATGALRAALDADARSSEPNARRLA